MSTLARAAALAIFLSACADLPAILDKKPERMNRPPLPTPELHTPTVGSLWSGESSRRFLAFENRAKRIGDLITVLIEEEATAESEATTDLERKSTFNATLNSDIVLQTLVTRPIISILSFLGFTDRKTDKDPTGSVSIVNAATTSKYEGDGTVEREANFTATIACIVTGVTESGLLEIEGERHLTINQDTQIIRLSGYVRPEDVRIDNTVPSSLIASADIQYGGEGVVADQQRAPWLARIFGLALPF